MTRHMAYLLATTSRYAIALRVVAGGGFWVSPGQIRGYQILRGEDDLQTMMCDEGKGKP